jgi:hypothetical protein
MAWFAVYGWRSSFDLEAKAIMSRLSIITAVGLAATSLFAQGPGRHMGEPRDFELVRAEFGLANKVVQGSPYSAQSTTQFTQTLANGDHIQRTSTGSIARDSQGRTRTERSFGAILSFSGRASAGRGAGRTVMIYDPVASKSIVLEPQSKTARSTTIPAARTADNTRTRTPRGLASAKTEDLGTQVMQGVNVQGKRVTRAIPAGQEGNEKEIDIVTETWFSPDLQAVVMSKTSDPRYGESVYQLTAITRAEPDPALFAVPSDYTVKEGRALSQGWGHQRPAAQ